MQATINPCQVPDAQRTKSFWHGRGFSLIELLVVISVIGILMALALPVLGRAMAKSRQIQCLNQLRETGVAFHSFAQEHSDLLPMQLWTNGCFTSNHTHEVIATNALVYSSCAFLAMSNELATPRLLACFADQRQPAMDFRSLKDENVSYAVGIQAALRRPTSILALDGNLTNQTGAVKIDWASGGSYGFGWTSRGHRGKGNVLYADAHVELRKNLGLAVLPVVEPALETPSGSEQTSVSSPNSIRANAAREFASRPGSLGVTPSSTDIKSGNASTRSLPSPDTPLNTNNSTNYYPAISADLPMPQTNLAPPNPQLNPLPSTTAIPTPRPSLSDQRPTGSQPDNQANPAGASAGGGGTAGGNDSDSDSYRGVVFGAKILYLLLLLWAIGVMLIYLLKYWWARKGRRVDSP
jgi:prepilin-type N-terminal cleavage/methylation domain-containing protein/prepilin-type processing-associated H-X9-DG protein